MVNAVVATKQVELEQQVQVSVLKTALDAQATGALALQRNLAAGESVSVSAQPPLAVVVGRADATEVTVRGKPFDLAAVSRDNVARFEVK